MLAFLLLGSACQGDSTESSLSGGQSSESEGGGSSTAAATTLTTADTTGPTGGSMSSADSSESGVTDTDTGASSSDSGGSTSNGTETGAGSSDSGDDTGAMPCVDDLGCDDLLPCNGVETCVDSFCAAGDPVVCDDGVPCTADACDEDTASCVAIALDANCSDGQFCNGAETCDAALDCQPGSAIVCDDGVACTQDACDEDAGACAFVPDDMPCNDGEFCNGHERCDLVLGCMPEVDFTCNDLVLCTIDSCDEDADACVHATDDAVCDNDVVCDGEELCDVLAGCQPGPAVDCGDDGEACTVEACNELTGLCETTLDNAACPEDEFCAADGCFAGQPCMDATTCQDGIACNGAELCVAGPGGSVCAPGTPIDCNDDIGCTADTCSEPGVCGNAPIDGLCADTDPCDGAETCMVGVGCVDGQPLVCDDGVDCSIDVCVTNFGCNNVPDDTACDDGLFCDGAETCSLQSGCVSAPPVTCGSDGIACTNDACDEDLDACVHQPDDDLCPCGEECSVALGGCGNDCALAYCDGHLYACGDCTDNDNDCDIDANDSNCFGACSNNESGLDGLIPGQDNAPCKHDCYFDGNSGAGDDDCYWSHECDPLAPSATTCNYDANAGIPGYAGNMDCANALISQSAECEAFCEPLTPNGCDCFGCCEVDSGGGVLTTVYLGSKVDGNDESTCTVDVLDDPELCQPCTQVPACINPCDPCEVCFGDPGPLPPECGGEQICAADQIACGQPGQDPCPDGGFCLTGCCQQF